MAANEAGLQQFLKSILFVSFGNVQLCLGEPPAELLHGVGVRDARGTHGSVVALDEGGEPVRAPGGRYEDFFLKLETGNEIVCVKTLFLKLAIWRDVFKNHLLLFVDLW